MLTTTLAVWLATIMVSAAPPEGPRRSVPGWEETPDARRTRYGAIAEAAARVALDPATPPLFAGAQGRAQTAALLLAIAHHESGFAPDVDQGPCYRGPGYVGRCDGGASACLMQVRVGDGQTREGWTRDELFADREKCFRAGLAIARRSARACALLPPLHRMTAYASGGCASALGKVRSAEIVSEWRRFLQVPKPMAFAGDALFAVASGHGQEESSPQP